MKGKKREYQKIEIEMADLCKAYAHPARLAIIRFMFNKEYCYVYEIAEALSMPLSSVSLHLKELKKVELIKAKYEHPRIKYSFNIDTFTAAWINVLEYFGQDFILKTQVLKIKSKEVVLN